MQEKIRAHTTPVLVGSGGGIWDDIATADAAGPMATVAHGTYAEALPVANMTVGAVRARFRDRFDIDPNATALLDSRPVDEDAVILAGQLLNFVRRAGEKGWHPCNSR
jgi:hypothetical protein